MLQECGDWEMTTIIYFVRHAESFYMEGQERSRGLSQKGIKDSETVKGILMEEEVDYFISSPYQRSIDTIRSAVIEYSKKISIEEDLRERAIGHFEPLSFYDAKQKVYEDFDFSHPGGEASRTAQMRGIRVIENILRTYKGMKIVIGTHGDMMTLMMNYYDNRFGFDFWQSTSMPDIYKLRFEGDQYLDMVRLW